MTFEQTKGDWEAHDGWQFADRDAERKYFYLAGVEAERKRCVEVARALFVGHECKLGYDWYLYHTDIASAIEKGE